MRLYGYTKRGNGTLYTSVGFEKLGIARKEAGKKPMCGSIYFFSYDEKEAESVERYVRNTGDTPLGADSLASEGEAV